MRTLTGAQSSSPVQTFTNRDAFITATGATIVPLPTSDQIGLSLNFPGVTVTAPNSVPTGFGGQGAWTLAYDVPPLFFLNQTNPPILAGAFAGNGEDDYLLTFDRPVNAVGLGIITNFSALETVTLQDEANNIIFADSIDVLTSPNSSLFIGFISSTPIKTLFLDTSSGGVENEAIFEIIADMPLNYRLPFIGGPYDITNAPDCPNHKPVGSVDYALPENTNVIATEDGDVVFSGQRPSDLLWLPNCDSASRWS